MASGDVKKAEFTKNLNGVEPHCKVGVNHVTVLQGKDAKLVETDVNVTGHVIAVGDEIDIVNGVITKLTPAP